MNSSYLTEAFKELNLLEEEAFDLDDQGMDDLKELISTEDDTIDIIDDEATEPEELEDSYVGKVILDCCVCHSKIYKDADSVTVNEEEELANEGEECPYCYSTDGYKIIGEIAPYKEDAELKVDVEDKDVEDAEGDDEEVEIEDEEKVEEEKKDKNKSSKKESLTKKSNKKLNERLYSLVPKNDSRASFYNKAKVQVDGNGETLISYDTPILKISNGKLEVLCDESALSATTMRHVKEFLLQAEEDGAIDLNGAKITRQWVISQINKGVKESLNKTKAKKRFNKKLSEAIKNNKGKKPLKESYADVFQDLIDRAESWIEDGDDKDEAIIHAIDDGLIYTRDIIDVAFHYGVIDDGQLLNDCWEDLYTDLYNEVKEPEEDDEDDEEFDESMSKNAVKEAFDRVELETEDKIIKVSEEEKPENPDEEMIVPLDADTESEIKVEDEEEIGEPSEDKFVDQDFDEIEEDDFNELGESYLKKVYGNVESFKTSRASIKGNTLKLEGVIKFSSGNSKETSFLFEAKDITKRGKLRFIGENQQITRGKKAFTLTGRLDGKKLVAESLNYNYRAKDANGKSTRLYGTIKRA